MAGGVKKMDLFIRKSLFQRNGLMKRTKKDIKVVPSVSKLLGLRSGACGIILDPMGEKGFAIKSFEGLLESEPKPNKKGKPKRLPKKEVDKIMKKVRPSLQLLHIQRGLVYLLENHMDIIYEAGDKSIDDGLREILDELETKKDPKKNIINVDFTKKGTLH